MFWKRTSLWPRPFHSQGKDAGTQTLKHAMALLLAATALSGCGHDVYARGGTTDTQYIQDENACFAYADKQPYAAIGGEGAHSANVAKERKDIRACMVAKGYTLKPKWPFGPYGESPVTGPNPAEAPLGTTR